MQLRLDDLDLVASRVVGTWSPPLRVFICHGRRPTPPPDLCDCGYEGEWENRPVFTWVPEPGLRRTDTTVRHDLAQGLPARSGDQGRWVVAGRDERCPECGDIERFDLDGELVDRRREHAGVIPLTASQGGRSTSGPRSERSAHLPPARPGD